MIICNKTYCAFSMDGKLMGLSGDEKFQILNLESGALLKSTYRKKSKKILFSPSNTKMLTWSMEPLQKSLLI